MCGVSVLWFRKGRETEREREKTDAAEYEEQMVPL